MSELSVEEKGRDSEPLKTVHQISHPEKPKHEPKIKKEIPRSIMIEEPITQGIEELI